MVDFYQYLYAQLEYLGAAPESGEFVLRTDRTPADENWITWGETIVSGFKSSTMACDHLIKNADAYEKKFVRAVDKRNVCPGL